MTVKAALSRPDVRFRLVADGREVINSPAGTLRQRAGDVLGKRVGQGMGEVHYEDEGVRVTGLVGAPNDSRATKVGIHIFVNDRPVHDFGITSAVIRAYEGLLMHQRYPIAVIFIQVSYDGVDVNIHPAKREVKFAHPKKVAGIVFRAVRETLQQMTRVFDSAEREGPLPRRDDWETPVLGIVREQRELWGGPSTQAQDRTAGVEDIPPVSSGLEGAPEFGGGYDAGTTQSTPEIEGMKFFGCVADTYIIMADERGLVLIDQHAAHERVVYERLKAAFGREAVPRQRLLFPISIELAGPDRAVVAAHLDVINKIGFEISEFGGTTFLVSAIPSVVKDADVEGLVRGIVEELREGTGGRGMEEVVDRMMKAVACHGAIRAGQALTPAEVEGLIAEIKRTPFAAHCPHGRPTMVRIDGDEIARRFKRI
jgi:DNA mismatch repair protein MutL